MGETVIGSGFLATPGGKGANQAVAASRLGGKVQIAGCTGDDIFGVQLKDNLAGNGVDIRYVQTVKTAPSGIAVITIHQGDNCIIIDPGANNLLTPDNIDEKIITGCDMVMVQLEIPLDTVRHVIDIAYNANVPVLLNPAPACFLPDELLSKISIFTPNETECGYFTGVEITSVEDAVNIIPKLLSRGIKQVVVTMGANGAVFNDGSTIRHQQAPRVQVMDTTAAGDCFSAALAVAICEGMPIGEAVRFACKAGSLAVQKKGAQESLPYRADIELK